MNKAHKITIAHAKTRIKKIIQLNLELSREIDQLTMEDLEGIDFKTDYTYRSLIAFAELNRQESKILLEKIIDLNSTMPF